MVSGGKYMLVTIRIMSYNLQFFYQSLSSWLKSYLQLPGKPFLTISVCAVCRRAARKASWPHPGASCEI